MPCSVVIISKQPKNFHAMSDHITFKNRLLGLQNNLLNFAYQLTTNREAAQDLVQDTTLKVLDNESKYVDNVNFKGWVFTIMRNIFINNYRRQVRSATVIDTTEDLYHLNLSQESGLTSPEGSLPLKKYRLPSTASHRNIRCPSRCISPDINIPRLQNRCSCRSARSKAVSSSLANAFSRC